MNCTRIGDDSGEKLEAKPELDLTSLLNNKNNSVTTNKFEVGEKSFKIISKRVSYRDGIKNESKKINEYFYSSPYFYNERFSVFWNLYLSLKPSSS